MRIKRYKTGPDGTLGKLYVNDKDTKLFCYTYELPWRSNAHDDPNTPQNEGSCIPAGKYNIIKETQPKRGNVFRLYDVPGRSGILIHSGNDEKDTIGCILVGFTVDNNKIKVGRSKQALEQLFAQSTESFVRIHGVKEPE